VKELPDDLTAMEADDLVHQGSLRDELLAPLFRRWPRLTQLEMGQLRALYAERVRIAKYLGRFRARRRSARTEDS
jgi:hypothetical protein